MYNKAILSETNGLTSTSANHLCNITKNLWKQLEIKLDNLNFVSSEMSLIGSTDSTPNRIGISEDILNETLENITYINALKAFVAYFREAIAQKDTSILESRTKLFPIYLKENNIQLEEPTLQKISFKEYLNNLPIEVQVKYYTLEARVTSLGKIVDKKGPIMSKIEVARKTKITPIVTEGNGRDTIIYKKSLSVPLETIESKYNSLHNTYRELQKQFNALKHKLEREFKELEDKYESTYEAELLKYNNKKEELLNQFRVNKDKDIRFLSNLKIIIPEQFKELYEHLNTLGK